MKKIFIICILVILCLSCIIAMPNSRTFSKIVIEAVGYGETYDIARVQALYELALKLYDPFVTSNEDYTKRITIADNKGGITEEEYQEYVHHITVYQEGWIFNPTYEAEYVYIDGKKMVKVTAWIGDQNVPTMYVMALTMYNDMGSLSSCIRNELPVCGRHKYARDRVRMCLKEEKIVLLRFKAFISFLVKFQVEDFEELLIEYEKLAETYYKDYMSFIEYENLD